MGNFRSTGLTSTLLLIIVLVIIFAVASEITGETTGTDSTSEDYDQIVGDIVDELSTYIQIKDQKGKFYGPIGNQKIQKIALLISPMATQNIDFSQLTIQIDNGKMINIMYYEDSADIGSNHLFEHNIWSDLNGSNYSLISINDYDSSISEYDTINKNSDLAYLVFELPSNFYMEKYDELKVTLFPSTGITRSVLLKAPMPMKSVITFE